MCPDGINQDSLEDKRPDGINQDDIDPDGKCPDGGRIVKIGRRRWRERGKEPGGLSPQGEFPARRVEPPDHLP